jgi:hypothetical protein
MIPRNSNVIRRNEIVGVLFYKDLFKPLGRLAFLALALEIEDLALRLCQATSVIEDCWQSISENRRRKAAELLNLATTATQALVGQPARRDWLLLFNKGESYRTWVY